MKKRDSININRYKWSSKFFGLVDNYEDVHLSYFRFYNLERVSSGIS